MNRSFAPHAEKGPAKRHPVRFPDVVDSVLKDLHLHYLCDFLFSIINVVGIFVAVSVNLGNPVSTLVAISL